MVIKEGDPIEFLTADGWKPAKFCGTCTVGKSEYVRIKQKIHRLYSYTTADRIRPVAYAFEKGNPNKTFKSRKEE